MKNGSFESGPWKESVGDCSSFDDDANIDMQVLEHPNSNNKYLSLITSDHISCTDTDIELQDNSRYVYSLDYQSDTNIYAKIYFRTGGENSINNLEVDVPINNDSWNKHIGLFNTDKVLNPKIFLYATSELIERESKVSYDNISIKKIDTIDQILIDDNNIFNNYEVSKSLIINDKNIEQNRLNNGSFEGGLWTKEVGNCWNYDDNPKIGMKLMGDKNKFLELSANRHSACTNQVIEVNEEEILKLRYDFNLENSEKAVTQLVFNDPSRTSYTDDTEAIILESKWNEFTKFYDVPEGATQARLYLYSKENNKKEGDAIVRYDNVELSVLPSYFDSIITLDQTSTADQYSTPNNYNYNIINGSKIQINLNNVNNDFLLFFSTKYNDNWEVRFKNNPVGDHEVADFQFNSWLISPDKICAKWNCENVDGGYNIELELVYKPYKELRAYVIASTISFILFSLFILVYNISHLMKISKKILNKSDINNYNKNSKTKNDLNVYWKIETDDGFGVADQVDGDGVLDLVQNDNNKKQWIADQARNDMEVIEVDRSIIIHNHHKSLKKARPKKPEPPRKIHL